MSDQNNIKEETVKKELDEEQQKKEENEKTENLEKDNDEDKDNNEKKDDIDNENIKNKDNVKDKNEKNENEKKKKENSLNKIDNPFIPLNKINKQKIKTNSDSSLSNKEEDISIEDDSISENKDDDVDEGEDEENDDEDDFDDDDDDEDDEGKTDSSFPEDKKKKDPYHSYINSKVNNFIYFDNLEKGDYLYGIEQNKFFKIVNINLKGNKGGYNIKLELIDNLKTKTKKDKILMKKVSENIIYKAINYNNKKSQIKIKDKNEEDKNYEVKNDINNKNNIINNKNDENKNENNKSNEESSNDIKKQNNEDEKELMKNNENKNENKNEDKENKEEKNKNLNNKENNKEENIKEENNNKEDNNKEKKKVDKNEIIKDNKKEDDNNNKNKDKDKDKEKDNEKTKNDKKKNNNEELDESSKKGNTKKTTTNKNITVTLTIQDYSKYTFLQKVNIFYINYLNICHRIDMIININSSISYVIQKFQRLYHIPCDRYSEEKPPLIFFINNKKYSTSNKTRKKYFIPSKFDYKNDYIIILEKENHKSEEIDMGTRNNYINLKGVKIPHLVHSSYYNLQVESLIISKNLPFLECEVYELKKEFYFAIDPENERTIKKKVKEFLELNWKERATLISVIKSDNIRKSKENYDANCFLINRKFILMHGKIYIFLVTSSNKKVYAFNPRHITKDGLVIISKDDKGILNGFKVKKMSDFIV